MNCPDTTKLNDYVDGELAVAEARALELHVAACASCRAQLDSLRALRGATAGLQKEIAPPRDLWPEIQSGVERLACPEPVERDPKPLRSAISLTALSVSKHGQADRATASRTNPPNALRIFAPLAIAASIALLVVVAERNAPLAQRAGENGRPAWSVAALEGVPRIGARSLAGPDKLRVGEWLVTDAASRARVEVAEIGEVNLERNSRLRLVGTSHTDHRVELARGELSAFIYAPPRIFFVDTPSATAVDLGCFYTLAVAEDGSGELHVTAGYVALEHGNRESIVPAGMKCKTRKGAGPGTPFMAEASEHLRDALDRFDFGRPPSSAALAEVLALAGRDDTVTLWHLLARTEGTARGAVFDALAKFQPPPAGVTRAAIVRGDDTMRRAWGEELGVGSFSVR